MRMRRHRTGFAALAAAAVVIMSLGTGALAQDEGPRGTLSIAFESDIATFDPAIGYDFVSWPAAWIMYDSLVDYAPDSTDLVPELATEMPAISDDGLTYTFTLRDDAFFVQKGEAVRPVTADDVVFSINRILRPDLLPTPSPVGPAFFAVIEGADAVLAGEAEAASGIEALDERTVRFTLSQPDRTFLNVLAMPFGAVLPADTTGYDSEAFSRDPVSTGPYWLDEYVVGERAVFRPNPHYWKEGSGKLEAIEFRLLVPTATQTLQVQNGELDIASDITPNDYVVLRDDPAWSDNVVADPLVTTLFVSMDTSGPDSPFGDVRVRQAVSHAVDKENVVRLTAGRGVIVNCIFPPGLPGFDETCDPYPHDIERAKELMAEAGVSGFSTQLYTDTTELSGLTAQSIASDLAQIGIEVEVIQQDFDVLLGTIAVPHQAPMVGIGWFQDFPDPSDFIDPILSCATAVEGGANFAWYCNEEADALAAEARTVTSLEEAIPLYQDIQARIMEDAPWVSTHSQIWTSLQSDRVQGFEHHHPVRWWPLEDMSVAE
jgi:ABC-type transport system substrate-binding protein